MLNDKPFQFLLKNFHLQKSAGYTHIQYNDGVSGTRSSPYKIVGFDRIINQSYVPRKPCFIVYRNPYPAKVFPGRSKISEHQSDLSFLTPLFASIAAVAHRNYRSDINGAMVYCLHPRSKTSRLENRKGLFNVNLRSITF